MPGGFRPLWGDKVARMTGERIGLLIHLLGAFAFIAGVVTTGVCFEVARRRHTALEIAALLRAGRIGAIVAGIGGVVLLLGGLWLAGDLDLYRTRWLQASVLAFLLSLLLGMAGGRRPRQAREMAQSIASGGGGDVDQMRRLLNDRAALITNWVAALLAVGVLVLMVWQPAL
jgi:hypothetical protein